MALWYVLRIQRARFSITIESLLHIYVVDVRIHNHFLALTKLNATEKMCSDDVLEPSLVLQARTEVVQADASRDSMSMTLVLDKLSLASFKMYASKDFTC